MEDKAEGRSQDIPVADLVERIGKILDEMQKHLLEKAREERSSCIATAYNWDDFMAALNNKKMVLAPWCDEVVNYSALTAYHVILLCPKVPSFLLAIFDQICKSLAPISRKCTRGMLINLHVELSGLCIQHILLSEKIW